MNDREREFARLLVGGMKRAEAYKRAFNKPEMDDVKASKYASRVVKKREVAEQIEALNGQMDKVVVASKQERMEALSITMRGCKDTGDVHGMVKCIAELNKMDGAYEAEKVELSGQLGVGAIVAAIQGAGSRPAIR